MNKNAWKIFKENLPATLQLSGIFSAFILLVYGILYLFEHVIAVFLIPSLGGFFGTLLDLLFVLMIMSLVISILSPLLYSYFAASSLLQTPNADQVKVSTYLKTYVIGCRHPVKGQLHIMSNLIYAVLIYFGVLIGVVVIEIAIMRGSNYLGVNDIFNQLQVINETLLVDQKQGLEMLDELLSSGQFEKLYVALFGYGNLFPALCGFYFFAHRITINILRFYASTSMGGLPAKPLHRLFKRGFSETKGVFYKDYYSTVYPLIILFILVFAGVYVGFAQIPGLTENIYILNITVISISAIILLPFYPVIFNLYNDIWAKVGSNYIKAFIDQASYELNLYKAQNQEYNEMQKQQVENLEKFVQNSKEMLDKQNQENEQKDEDEDNKKDDN